MKMKRRVFSILLAGMIAMQGVVPTMAELEEEYVVEETVDEEPVEYEPEEVCLMKYVTDER